VSSVLAFDDVTKTYGGHAALDGVSFHMEDGETLGLVGESGSGKSTIARIAAGLLPPSSGRVTLLGQRIDQHFNRRLRAQLGLVFQNPYESLNPRQRIETILRLPLRVHTTYLAAEQKQAIHYLLDRVGLSPAADFARKRPDQLSGGQRQRVAIARAIALQPRLLIADEPVSALDVSICGQILNLLRDVGRQFGSSTLFISHDLAVVQAMCDRVLVLHRGRIIESGPTAAVLGNPSHPYTLQLLASLPASMTRADLLAAEPPPRDPATGGCLFADRCRFAMPRCGRTPPRLPAGPQHQAMCWLLDGTTEVTGWHDLRHAIAARSVAARPSAGVRDDQRDGR
jgi:oligopeptide/dipeptide ABC transporter ATP-binding protein